VKVVPEPDEELPLSVSVGVALAVLEVLVAALDLVVVGSAVDSALAELFDFTGAVVGCAGVEDVTGSTPALTTGTTVDEGSADELVFA
jgi:hypothetical protein